MFPGQPPMKALVGAIARNWPFANGAGRFIDKVGRVDLGSGPRTCRTSDGFDMIVMADDLVGRHLILSGEFDRSPVAMLLAHAREGDVVADIGANIGYVSCLVLARVRDSRVVCFEPNPAVAALLRTNLSQFGGSRWEVHEAALSDRDGEGGLDVSAANLGGGSLKAGGSVPVKMIDAARLFSSFERLDLIKIDVEGHEEPIFRAMATELRRLRPRAILFEDQLRKAAPDGPIGAILKRCGYRVSGIRKRLMKTELAPIRTAADCTFNDYLAVPG